MKKTAIVTGGSRGIGKEIAKMLAENGYRVIINFKSSWEKAKENQKELLEKGYDVDIFQADVSIGAEVKEMFRYCREKYGSLDLLVNNAGISSEGLITDLSEEEWNHIIDVNLKSVFLCSKEALGIMLSNHSGKIINITSMWGVTGGSCEVAYSASKAGIIGFTKALAKEVGPSGINVNAVAPGVIMTDMMDGFSDEDIDTLKNDTPLMRVGTPRDIANVVRFLASDDSDFITGQVIGSNGGFVI